MKTDPAKLIYHSMHRRPMPGCLPLFFLLAALVTGSFICLVSVTMPTPYRARGTGAVSYRNDELTRFQVRQRSALPLRLPTYADPAAQLLLPAKGLPLCRNVQLQEAPVQTISPEPPDSAVLDAATLLRLPPTDPAPETEVEP